MAAVKKSKNRKEKILPAKCNCMSMLSSLFQKCACVHNYVRKKLWYMLKIIYLQVLEMIEPCRRYFYPNISTISVLHLSGILKSPADHL